MALQLSEELFAARLRQRGFMLGPCNNVGRHPKPFGNVKRLAPPRQTVDEPIAGRQRSKVEVDRRTGHLRRGHRIGLNRTVMGRHQCHRATLVKALQQRHSQRPALHRICARPQVV